MKLDENKPYCIHLRLSDSMYKALDDWGLKLHKSKSETIRYIIGCFLCSYSEHYWREHER